MVELLQMSTRQPSVKGIATCRLQPGVAGLLQNVIYSPAWKGYPVLQNLVYNQVWQDYYKMFTGQYDIGVLYKELFYSLVWQGYYKMSNVSL